MSTVIAVSIALSLSLLFAGTMMWQYLRCNVVRQWTRRIKLPDPCGFSETNSIGLGEPLVLFTHSSKPVQIELHRWGANGLEWISTHECEASIQSNRLDMWNGFPWQPTIQIPTDGLRPGLYAIVLKHQHDSNQVWRSAMIIKPSKPAPIAIVASTNTWQAYNEFGGLSNYRDSATALPLRWLLKALHLANVRWLFGTRHFVPIVPLSLSRPNSAIDCDLAQLDELHASVSHLVRAESELVQFLEQIDAPYAVYSDDDFAFTPDATQSNLVIFNTHSEYWTQESEARLEQFVQRGGRVAFLSGNNMFRIVQRLDRALAVVRQSTDAESVATRIGCAYDARGYLTYAPYRVEQPNHWMFAGEDLQAGDLVGESVIGGASGYETDKPNFASGDFEVIAVGAQNGGAAFMVYRDTPQGGWILNCGSVAFTSALRECPVLMRMVRNCVEQAVWEPQETLESSPAA